LPACNAEDEFADRYAASYFVPRPDHGNQLKGMETDNG